MKPSKKGIVYTKERILEVWKFLGRLAGMSSMDPFSLEETFIIHFKSSAMKSLTRKNFRQVQPLGGFLFPILLFFKKGFGLKKKILLSERVFYFIKWLEFFSPNYL